MVSLRLDDDDDDDDNDRNESVYFSGEALNISHIALKVYAKIETLSDLIKMRLLNICAIYIYI